MEQMESLRHFRWFRDPVMELSGLFYHLVNHLATMKNSHAGAMANGWLGKNCSTLYPMCHMAIRLVSQVP